LNPVPVIITGVPTAPDETLSELILKPAATIFLTLNTGPVAVTLFTVTVTIPEVAPWGTEVVMDVVVTDVITAGVPLKNTPSANLFVLKPVPLIITTVFVLPESMLSEVIATTVAPGVGEPLFLQDIIIVIKRIIKRPA